MAWSAIEGLYEPLPKKEADEVARILSLKKTHARFLADENFPADAIALMRSRGLKVETAAEAGLLHHPDENYVAYALRQGMVLVTCDRDYLIRRRFPLISCCTIVIFDFGGGTLAEKESAMRCLIHIDRAPSFYDKWTKIHAKPDEWTEESRHLNGTISRSRLRLLWNGRLEEWVED